MTPMLWAFFLMHTRLNFVALMLTVKNCDLNTRDQDSQGGRSHGGGREMTKYVAPSVLAELDENTENCGLCETFFLISCPGLPASAPRGHRLRISTTDLD